MSSDAPPRAPVGGSQRTWRAQAAIVVVAWGTLLGLTIGLGLLVTGPLRESVLPLDNDLARWFAGDRTAALNNVAETVSYLGDTITVVLLGPLTALVAYFWRRDVRVVVFVVTAVVGAYGIYILAAGAVDRPRPPVRILDPGLEPTHSFPSGHVGAATALYGLIVVLVWIYARSARWWVTPLLLLPVLVAVSRLYQGAHHLSDVLASMIYASMWLTVVTLTLLPGRPRASLERARP
jgi:undecaprenyl-diphosphatase